MRKTDKRLFKKLREIIGSSLQSPGWGGRWHNVLLSAKQRDWRDGSPEPLAGLRREHFCSQMNK